MRTLILNLNYKPLCTVDFRRGLKLLIKQSMTVLHYYDKHIMSEKQSHQIPAVMLYTKYIEGVKISRPTKTNILKRDNYTCQYCAIKLEADKATVDHIKPVCTFKAKGDANTWTNMVACCKKCNTKKGNKLLRETEMKLLKEPKEINSVVFRYGNIPDEWQNYL